MKRSRFTQEQVIAVLKVHQAGVAVADLCRKHGISDATFYTWRSKYGGMEVAPPAGPSAIACPAPASGCPACARQASPGGKVGTAACGSAGRLPAPAGYAAADSQTSVAHPPRPAAAAECPHRLAVGSYSG